MQDAIHPGPAGHLLLADLLLRRLHPCRPPPRATIRIDLSGRRPAGVNVAIPGTNVFVPPEARAALALLDQSRRAAFLGEQGLVLTGLDRPVKLRVGPCCNKTGPVVELGTFSPEELARGIVLDRDNVPWVEQAARIHALLERRGGEGAESSQPASRPTRYWVELNFSP